MIELTKVRIYDFEEFQLDAKSHRLFRRADDEIVPLTPKAVEVLSYLVENAGRVLSKEEIIENVWENSFVEEANLSQTIFVLRKALSEDTKKPRFILTVPNRGYQFIAEVRPFIPEDQILEESFLSDSHPEILVSKPQVSDSNPKSKIQNPKLIWLAVPLVLLIAFGIYWFYPKSKPAGLSEIKTIAILPFEDLSDGQTEKYLGVSLADALANKFSELKEITVRPTRSVLKYTDSLEDLSKIGRELQVDAVLDGRIQRIGEQMRVNVQMIRVSDNTTIWTEQFDDKFTNFFAVQDSISQKVVKALALQINDKERERFNKRGTENAEAYQDYLRGRYFWNKRTRENLRKAIAQFEQATQKDPNFALAYAGMADCYQLLPEYWDATPQEAFPKAKAAVQKALELDEQTAEAHTALGYIQAFYDWDFTAAEKSFKRAIEINPNYATAHQWYAEFLVIFGRFDEAHEEMNRALGIDPVSPIILTDQASTYYMQRQYSKTMEYCRKVIEMEPDFAYSYSYLAFSQEQTGNFAEASENHAKAMTLFGEPPEFSDEVREAFKKNGMLGWWQKRLKQFENHPYLKNSPSYTKAFVYLRVGNKEKALEMLSKGFEERDRFMVGLKYAPDFDLLRDDPRFKDLLRRMGF